ncbi:MAG: transcription antitermination factor NusB [Marinifilaceae bacterium]
MTSRRLIRIKVLQLLYSYIKRESVTLGEIEHNLTSSLSKSSDLYFYTLQLMLEMRRTAYLRIDNARNRRYATKEDLNPNTRFIENPVFDIIENNLQFQSNINTRFVSWSNETETVTYFLNKLMESDLYKTYMSAKTVSYEEHRQFIMDIFTEILAQDEQLFESFEDKSIFWNDDFDLVFSIVYKTLKNVRENATPEKNILFPIFHEPDDSEYGKKLLRKTILENANNLELIEEFTPNWEVERISDIDRVILSAAISELRNFPSIPVKVTLDEFIEISKSYSSAKSGSFINGVLDNIVTRMKEKEELVKTGRGLLEETRK